MAEHGRRDRAELPAGGASQPTGEVWQAQTEGRYANRRVTRFTGKELDEGTGLYYFGARWYHPRLSQWASPDPILARYMRGSPNLGVLFPRNLGLYTYSANNPVVLLDPNGELFDAVAAAAAEKAAEAGVAIGGATVGVTVVAIGIWAYVGYGSYKLYQELPSVQDRKAREEAAKRAASEPPKPPPPAPATPKPPAPQPQAPPPEPEPQAAPEPAPAAGGEGALKGGGKPPPRQKAKERRAADRARTEQGKKAGTHRGKMKEAHEAQKKGEVEDLIDKEQSIKEAYPDQAAGKTGQRIKEKLKQRPDE